MTNNDISASDVTNYFLKEIASDLFDAIKNGLPPSTPIPCNNHTQLIKVLYFMSCYKAAWTQFFHPNN